MERKSLKFKLKGKDIDALGRQRLIDLNRIQQGM